MKMGTGNDNSSKNNNKPAVGSRKWGRCCDKEDDNSSELGLL